jgi:tetratricopeptide (TPR) repeat protein/predicted Ser/Thr protein kinase
VAIEDDILVAAILRLDFVSPKRLDALRASLAGRPLRDALLQEELLTPTELAEAELAASIRKPTKEEVGIRFGRYRVDREIGRGSYATVYLAHDPNLNRPVALKIFSGFMDVESESMARFRHEAAMSARLNHPGIAAVYETAVEKGFPYIAMEYVAGKTLTDLFKEWQPGEREKRVRLIRDVARAVQSAHEQGVIHRDLKPGNVIVDDAGRPHVVDFGLAKDAAVFASLTATGATVGTPAYMSPEQARGDAKIDARCDVYALGVLLYESLALRRAFGGETIAAVLHHVLETEPEPLRKIVPGIERDLEIICARAMAKVPSERYPSAADFADDLDRHLAGEAVQARSPSVAYRVRKSVRRHRTAWIAGLAVALVSIALFIAWFGVSRSRQHALDEVRARELLHASAVHAQRGSFASAWSVLRDVELRYGHTAVLPEAFRAMVDLVRLEGGRDHVPAQEPYLRRLLAARPSAADKAWAHLQLARVYESCQQWADARAHYLLASGDEAAFGAEWARIASRQALSPQGGAVASAGDIDGDGREELLVAEGTNLHSVGWNGAALVVERTWAVPAPGATWLLADLDRDGKPELLAFRAGVSVYELPGLRQLASVPLGEGAGCFGTAGDLDGDGRADVAVARHWPVGRLFVVRFAPDWSPTVLDVDNLEPSESDPRGLVVADLDGDRSNELVFSAGEWSRYDVTVYRMAEGRLRRVARRQIGNNDGLAALDVNGDGRAELFTGKYEILPNVRLFEDDPRLGGVGPVMLRLEGTRLTPELLDRIEVGGPRVFAGRGGLGPVVAFGNDRDPGWDFYFFKGGAPRHRRFSVGSSLGMHSGAMADLDGDGAAEIVLGGGDVVALGLGPDVSRSGRGWIEIAKELRARGLFRAAIDAYGAVAAESAQPGEAFAGQAECLAALGEPRKALDCFRQAADHGYQASDSLLALLRTAELLGEWELAAETARKLGDGSRVAALSRMLGMKPAFAQEFSEALDPHWEIREPLAWRQIADPAVLRMVWMPGDAPLRLPLAWDGSSMRMRWWLTPRSMQYANQLSISLRHRDSAWSATAVTEVYAGGGSIRFGVVCHVDGLPGGTGGGLELIDWRRLDAGALLTISYVQHLNRWEVTIDAEDGTRFGHHVVPGRTSPPAGTWLLDIQGRERGLLMATQCDLRRVEIAAAPGAVALAAGGSDDASRLLSAGEFAAAAREYEGRSDAADRLRYAVALAMSGEVARGAAVLADLRRAATGSASMKFEFQGRAASRWELVLARLMLLDETLAWKLCESGALAEPREYGGLLARLAYQQHVDSGQTAWREAVAMLRRAVALSPKDPHAWYLLGFCRFKLGDFAASRAAMEQAAGLEPSIERDFEKQGGPALFIARIAARQQRTAEVHEWLLKAKAAGGNLDIARHDRLIGPMFEDERFLREFGD